MTPSDNIKKVTDSEILVGFKQTGESAWIGELYNRYVHLVYGVCLKYLQDEEQSKDITMHVFEKLHTDLIKFEIENFRGWLYQTTKNQCFLLMRSRKSEDQKRRQYIESEGEFMEYQQDEHLSDKPEGLEEDQLHEALKKLKKEQRKCVELFYLKIKSYEEISELTGYPMKKVKSYIQNGKRNLKILLTTNADKMSSE